MKDLLGKDERSIDHTPLHLPVTFSRNISFLPVEKCPIFPPLFVPPDHTPGEMRRMVKFLAGHNNFPHLGMGDKGGKRMRRRRREREMGGAEERGGARTYWRRGREWEWEGRKGG